jgi:hypothetical protein
MNSTPGLHGDARRDHYTSVCATLRPVNCFFRWLPADQLLERMIELSLYAED